MNKQSKYTKEEFLKLSETSEGFGVSKKIEDDPSYWTYDLEKIWDWIEAYKQEAEKESRRKALEEVYSLGTATDENGDVLGPWTRLDNIMDLTLEENPYR